MNSIHNGRFAKGNSLRVGLKHSEEAKEKIRLSKIGKKQSDEWKAKKAYHDENHPLWKEKPSYNALHSWIRRKLGSPKKCSQCDFTSENNYQIHWANISHEYKRDVNDFIRMCASCHKKYDLKQIELCV